MSRAILFQMSFCCFVSYSPLPPPNSISYYLPLSLSLFHFHLIFVSFFCSFSGRWSLRPLICANLSFTFSFPQNISWFRGFREFFLSAFDRWDTSNIKRENISGLTLSTPLGDLQFPLVSHLNWFDNSIPIGLTDPTPLGFQSPLVWHFNSPRCTQLAVGR